jgi:hypothetical protein
MRPEPRRGAVRRADDRGMTTPREAVLSLPTLDALTAHVHVELCKFDSLDPTQTPLRQTHLTRRGKASGVLFHVQGPRLLRASGVWSIDDGRLLFYDSTGTRARAVRLSESPDAPAKRAA